MIVRIGKKTFEQLAAFTTMNPPAAFRYSYRTWWSPPSSPTTVFLQVPPLLAPLEVVQEQLRSDPTMAHRASSVVDEGARWTRANERRHTEIERIDEQLAAPLGLAHRCPLTRAFQ